MGLGGEGGFLQEGTLGCMLGTWFQPSALSPHCAMALEKGLNFVGCYKEQQNSWEEHS